MDIDKAINTLNVFMSVVSDDDNEAKLTKAKLSKQFYETLEELYCARKMEERLVSRIAKMAEALQQHNLDSDRLDKAGFKTKIGK